MPKKKKRAASSAKKSGPVDAYLGAKIREARKSLGLSQTELGETVGITFQQVQKYESGRNRLSVSRLLQLCRTLKINIADMLSEVPKDLH